jgi:hypothetical protein
VVFAALAASIAQARPTQLWAGVGETGLGGGLVFIALAASIAQARPTQPAKAGLAAPIKVIVRNNGAANRNGFVFIFSSP